MERIVTIFLISGFLIMLSVVSLADTNAIVNVSDDTWAWQDTDITGNICNYGYNFNLSVNKSYGNNNTILLLYFRGDSQPFPIKSFFKFNVTNVQSKIVKNVTMMSNKIYSSCGLGSTTIKPVYFLNNDTWDETNLTGYNAPSGEINFNIMHIPYSVFYTDNLMNYSKFANDIYTDNFSTLVVGSGHSPFPGCANPFNSVCIKSDEYDSMGSWLNFTLTDYYSNYISITDLSGICLDFESGAYYDNGSTWNDCAAALPEWDFFYDLVNNKIYPNEPLAFAGRMTTETNESLGFMDCNLFGTTAYTYNQYSNVNPPATPALYDSFCFNQSYVHAVKGFYGAIKIINNTNVRYSLECPLNDCHDIDFYWALYSPSFSTFSQPVLTPNPPIADVNLTVQWTTNTNMYGWLKFRYNLTGNYSNYFYAWDENLTYGTYHTVTINGQYILGAYYQFYLEGNDTSGNNYTSPVFNFSVVGDRISWITENSTIPSVMQGLVDNGIVADLDTAYLLIGVLIVSGFSMFIMIVGNSAKLGILSFISLMIAFGTALYIPSSMILIIIVFAALIVAKIAGKFWG